MTRDGGGAERRRAVLRGIDGALDTLESWHLQPAAPGGTTGAVATVLGELEAVAQGPLPEPVRQAPSTYHLHLALLAWQSELLDGLVPDRRRRFPDLDDDGDEPLEPALRSVRRRADETPEPGGAGRPARS